MNDSLALAKLYPYPRPYRSYLFADGHALELDSYDSDPLETGVVIQSDCLTAAKQALGDLGIKSFCPLLERTAVLAYGSNGAPSQLARKFSNLPGTVIPILSAELTNYDVVYSAHLTHYGSIPATIATSPGTTLKTSVAYLTPRQLSVLHRTELGHSKTNSGHYTYRYLNADVTISNGETLDGIPAYTSRHGAYSLKGLPIALNKIVAINRQFSACDQVKMLEQARIMLEPKRKLDSFLLDVINDSAIRSKYNGRLRSSALNVMA